MNAFTHRNCYLAAYDISEAQRRSAALRLPRRYAPGWQKSFFECFLSSNEHKTSMVEIAAVLEACGDRLLLILLDARQTFVFFGIATPASLGPFLLGER